MPTETSAVPDSCLPIWNGGVLPTQQRQGGSPTLADSGTQAPVRLLHCPDLGLQLQYPLRTPGYIALRCLFDLTYYLRSWSPKLTLVTKVRIVTMGASRGGLSQLICRVKLTGVWIY